MCSGDKLKIKYRKYVWKSEKFSKLKIYSLKETVVITSNRFSYLTNVSKYNKKNVFLFFCFFLCSWKHTIWYANVDHSSIARANFFPFLSTNTTHYLHSKRRLGWNGMGMGENGNMCEKYADRKIIPSTIPYTKYFSSVVM